MKLLDKHTTVPRRQSTGAPAATAPCPPHDWRCPVIMKLDPDHVAWTCAHCGAMALTDDLALKPTP